MIEALNISVLRSRQRLLHHVDFSVNPGEIVMLLGPNGAGKTTLLRSLSGQIVPDQGEILVNGQPIQLIPLSQLSLRRAVVSQSVHMSFPFSTLEVVLMGIQLQNQSRKSTMSMKDQRILATKALIDMQVEHLSDRMFLELSGGEQQRVHIARALVQLWTGCQEESQFLFLDEPTSALDLKYQVYVLRYLRELASAGIGICCVIHDLQLAALYSDRLVIMKHGSIAAEGPSEQLINASLLKDIYEVSSHILQHPVTHKPLAVVGD
ncbi:heme ABC transporter ATP-binding protein [Hahella sp. CCB-MM4]|uniref:heme ABC transporter ATP-binding protein n=1 Tax=Hahella sp. (strain CCB-MM4) TaxID=1926491 RepID=UPI000B9AEB3D|nr:heme ABC transporter ATP-binding protein [Hahella sp. CCB-MM4]OZG75379.1 heme ABC transporter ATP-binding protein [Hahella sp. CCB-MM4]